MILDKNYKDISNAMNMFGFLKICQRADRCEIETFYEHDAIAIRRCDRVAKASADSIRDEIRSENDYVYFRVTRASFPT